MTDQPPFRVLAFYSTTVEPDHIAFAEDAIRFYTTLAETKQFTFETTTDWERLNNADLAAYRVVVWLNHFPRTEPQRAAFERYMQNGGAWLGLHVSGYNDRYTNWDWFVEFLGGAVFYSNNWPALPALLTIDAPDHPVAWHVPAQYIAPADEWYMWKPSPRLHPDIQVLATLDSSNYPLGQKNILTEGDIPVVWTNMRYRMLYMNMGHRANAFDAPAQARLFTNALLWLGGRNFEGKQS